MHRYAEPIVGLQHQEAHERKRCLSFFPFIFSLILPFPLFLRGSVECIRLCHAFVPVAMSELTLR